ncbi:MAG TPA: ABC transporter ATP-binding protein [Candidatus Saccharicenans sp.]|jgi:putative ABC transport system ATP-binding protein|nr:ABC transporter ATP-binding protein [Candidatus Saccharicenans sp.]HOL45013.1 ABC transporter ATP-binding protein [Candidatus Saccharicenans sp.]HOM93432.1 ABC transporter ATP-binding protein [Candidatus Saccharicenans sp.]HOP60375.1 ABC transporter ATP-binding protein [Candidatus Saccharicenans sp.]HOT68157.1 ABC transporter ATP-binding protein [Candidatus Saccharicenans sp.]
MNEKIIVLENIVRIYKIGEVEVQALRGISYSIERSEFLAIMGPSGSGKTTLMSILGLLDRPTSGRYFLEGEDVSSLSKDQMAAIRNKKIGFVFQNFNLLSRTTALENVELPLLYSNINSKESKERALAALVKVGLKGWEYHRTNQLSGGQMQRVAIARALVNEPSIILADEPTGNLDSKNGAEIMDIFTRLNREQKITLVMVTHDPVIASYARRRLYLKDGQIIREEINGKADSQASVQGG